MTAALLPSPSIHVHTLIGVEIPSRITLSPVYFSRDRLSLLCACPLLVKVAAVIGETFSLDVLRAIFPMDLDEESMRAHLSTLVFKNFLTEEDSSSRSQIFKFTHSMVRAGANLSVKGVLKGIHGTLMHRG